ncbi:hypothetical protein KSP39_PZI005968 [Platanthera zijinensis]|uniref:Uncharacterized protein n=1 Tax=Platanthera zijinensis TaxID=2320716 RepID=A0AAP0BTP0_9ASPA
MAPWLFLWSTTLLAIFVSDYNKTPWLFYVSLCPLYLTYEHILEHATTIATTTTTITTSAIATSPNAATPDAAKFNGIASTTANKLIGSDLYWSCGKVGTLSDYEVTLKGKMRSHIINVEGVSRNLYSGESLLLWQ